MSFIKRNGINKADADFFIGILKEFDSSYIKEEEIYKPILEIIQMTEKAELLSKDEFITYMKYIKESIIEFLFIEINSSKIIKALEKVIKELPVDSTKKSTSY